MNEIIYYVLMYILWYASGFLGYYWIETSSYDIKRSELPLMLLFSFFGPFMILLAFVNLFERWTSSRVKKEDKVIFKKRK